MVRHDLSELQRPVVAVRFRRTDGRRCGTHRCSVGRIPHATGTALGGWLLILACPPTVELALHSCQNGRGCADGVRGRSSASSVSGAFLGPSVRVAVLQRYFGTTHRTAWVNASYLIACYSHEELRCPVRRFVAHCVRGSVALMGAHDGKRELIERRVYPVLRLDSAPIYIGERHFPIRRPFASFRHPLRYR
jgi:hypothetical protein